jgi:hypothetical protein
MKHTIPCTAGPTRKAPPLALIYTSRLLLTEKSTVTDNLCSLSLMMETRTIRATMVTPVLKQIRGYNHFGIND